MRTQVVRISLILALGTLYLPASVQASVYLVDTAPTAVSVPQPPYAANEAASTGKTIVEWVVQNDKEQALALGFRSADEATDANMKIGSAIAVMSIDVDTLKGYSPGSDLTGLFKPTDQFIYPITVGGKVRSAITVRKVKKTGLWKAIAFGAYGAPLAAEQLNILDSAFIVRLYELELWFLGTLSGQELTFFPLKLAPAHGISIGKQENGHDALTKLAEEAKRFDSSAFKKRSRPE
jgi:hypothetical protein